VREDKLFLTWFDIIQIVSILYDLFVGCFCSSRVIYPANDIANVYHDLAKKVSCILHTILSFSVSLFLGTWE
jgi:hypothetical protein